ncbi:MAG: hypothetical protein AB7F32_02300, partial [Victivallaceae bacterium]
MAEINKARETALSCMQEIARMLPQGTNLEAYLADTPEDPVELVTALGEKLKLNPLRRTDVPIEELAAYFGAPLLLRLRNGNFVIFLGIRRGGTPDGKNDRYAVYDPLIEGAGKQILPDAAALTKAWEGEAVFFRNLNNPGFSADGRHTALYSLVAIAKHHGAGTDVNKLLHTYAVSEAEPSRRLLGKMADDLDFESKSSNVKWNNLKSFGNIFPIMAFRRDGSAAVLCGIRPNP